jgi:DNA topoisomerase-1
VLWRKLPGARSAGRVQSVALRLVCDRELEIEKFVAREYWSLVATLATPRGDTFEARLVGADGKKIQRSTSARARGRSLQAALETAPSRSRLGRGQARARNPPPPFTTSTLQQEASRKLGFAPAHTMRIAQRLYEGIDIGGETVGLITYMRTDGVQIAPEAITRPQADRRDYGKPTCRTRRANTDQGQERAGSARGDPPDRPVAPPARDVAAYLDTIRPSSTS